MSVHCTFRKHKRYGFRVSLYFFRFGDFLLRVSFTLEIHYYSTLSNLKFYALKLFLITFTHSFHCYQHCSIDTQLASVSLVAFSLTNWLTQNPKLCMNFSYNALANPSLRSTRITGFSNNVFHIQPVKCAISTGSPTFNYPLLISPCSMSAYLTLLIPFSFSIQLL